MNSQSFSLGEIVRLTAGGPDLMVVDVLSNRIVVAWRGKYGTQEITLPMSSVRRIAPAPKHAP